MAKKSSKKSEVKKKGSSFRDRADRRDGSQFRSNLLAVVSHELNTPISAIINATEMISASVPPDHEGLMMLRRNAARLQRTVRNLMEIARVDAGTLRVRLSELNLENFLRIRRQELAEKPALKIFRVVLEIEDGLPHACGDLRRLGHVVDSLILNAAKFSNQSALKAGETGTILVQAKLESASMLPPEFQEPSWGKKTGLYLFVSIQSSLPPMGESPDHFEELFEPFTPWRDADTRSQEGLGVELALAKEILLAHEGFIWADMHAKEHSASQGWTFHLALPVLSRSDELDMVLANRLFTAIGALSRVSLLIIRPEPGAFSGGHNVVDVIKAVQRLLFRSSDSIFWIEEMGELTVLMDDCNEVSAERVGERIVTALNQSLPDLKFMWTTVTGPSDGSTAEELLARARERWTPGPK